MESMPSAAELAEAYWKGAVDLRAAVAGMSRAQLIARPIPGRWSTLEVLAHLADFEPVFADRMLRVLALPDPLMLAADETLFTKAMDYHSRDAEEELAMVEATRKKYARIIRGLTPEQLKKTGVHSTRGLQTLEQVIVSVTHHIPHHLPFVQEKRKALGLA